MEDYQIEYDTLIKKLKDGVAVDGEEVGKTIAIMAQYFGTRNLMLAGKENLLRTIAAKTINTIEANGKPISAAKSEIIIAATEEAKEYREQKAHQENINQEINALKSLQRGLVQEMGHMGGI